ncbi:CTP synthase 1-like isoform X2 [Loxodonta africana]|uniref:CTP synthase 1-like isoform X2 n=1 Tax=Loxodonta africana TaxID=9785 RepID=UPI0030D476A5
MSTSLTRNAKEITWEKPSKLGGTVGDIESMPFTEASVNSNSKSKERTFVFCNILVSLVPEDQMETFGKEKLQLRESGLKPS